MLYGVKARRSGALGYFNWYSLEAPNKDEAFYIAHRNGFEVNVVSEGPFRFVGAITYPANFAPLLGGKREIPCKLAWMTKLAD